MMKQLAFLLIASALMLAVASLGKTAVSAAPNVLLRRIPTGLNSIEADNHSGSPQISADGRYIIFQSDASNLVPNDTNNALDAFVYDRETGSVERVSLTAGGTEVSLGVCCFEQGVDISGDGRYVVFQSGSDEMDDTAGQNTWTDIFLRDRQTGTVTQVTHAFDGTATNENTYYPAISADGGHIVFQSDASNLTANDTNNETDVFVYSAAAQTISLISVAADGGSGNGRSNTTYGGSISGDGRFVIFYSRASNLVANDTNINSDVFVRDRDADEDGIFDETGPGEMSTQMVSVTPGGEAGAGFSYSPFITGNGRYVLFASTAPDLVIDDNNMTMDVFMRDMLTGITEIVSLKTDGSQGDGGSSNSAASDDGRFILFQSTAQLINGEPNLFQDIYLRDRQTGTTTLISIGESRANLSSLLPSLSADGRTAVFQSFAFNLVANDTNNVSDLFLYNIDPSYHLYLPLVLQTH